MEKNGKVPHETVRVPHIARHMDMLCETTRVNQMIETIGLHLQQGKEKKWGPAHKGDKVRRYSKEIIK
jgi:hypothetical protein